jgi:hypothetical protein
MPHTKRLTPHEHRSTVRELLVKAVHVLHEIHASQARMEVSLAAHYPARVQFHDAAEAKPVPKSELVVDSGSRTALTQEVVELRIANNLLRRVIAKARK